MGRIHVVCEQRITKPVDLVRRQFHDMRHHATHPVHPDVHYTLKDAPDGACFFTLKTRIAGMMQIDEVEQRFESDGRLVARTISGTNAGAVLAAEFIAETADATRVILSLDAPATGLKALIAPVLSWGARRVMSKALDEDRRDLEERGYGSA